MLALPERVGLLCDYLRIRSIPWTNSPKHDQTEEPGLLVQALLLSPMR